MTAGSSPPDSVVQGTEAFGVDVTHTYGLTKPYGPSVVSLWNDDWSAQDISDKAKLKSRQGVPSNMLEGLDVVDPEKMMPAPP
jgi:fatty-acyl-CoA synthase